jgi:hypothetical protein
MTVPTTLADIRTKVRRITGRPSTSQMTDAEIDQYINTYYVFDFPEQLKLESLRVNYEFTTTANIPVYDFPTDTYLAEMPPVLIAGYESYMTQSRGNFFRINTQLNLLNQSVATGDGTTGPYTGILSSTPIMPGFKPNPPGAYSDSSVAGNDIGAQFLKWNVVFSGLGSPDPTSGIAPSITLVDDGQGNLFDPTDTSTNPAAARGSINYLTGAFSLTFASGIPIGNAINAQYIPYGASRPQSVVFFEDQVILYPVPDQAYTVSFEVYKYPTSFDGTATTSPQLNEWWQLLAYGAAEKIFADNADFESLAKFRPLLQEQLNLVQRRTIVQQTSERTATIYTEQANGAGQFPFGNLFGNF